MIEGSTWVVVGAIARYTAGDELTVRRALVAVPGVSILEVGDDDRLGLLIEARDLDAAHDILTQQVASAPGVLAVFPVALECDDDSSTVARPRQGDGS